MRYSYNRKVEILKNINFTLNRGEHLSIIGINGCGKSTLLKCICNFLDYRGSIKIDNIEVSKMNSKELSKRVSILSQNMNVYFDYKVVDVIKFGRYCYGKNLKDHDYSNLIDILKNMGIYHLKDKYTSELSGGELQKVFISRILFQDPYVVLLDEFNNNLDLGTQIYMLNNLKSLFEDRILISVFHDLNLVRRLGSKIMVLKGGEVYKYGDESTVFNRRVLNDVYGVDVEQFMKDSFYRWIKN